MLIELLRLLNSGGLHATSEVARRLGVSEGLVLAMAGDLERRGYLVPLSLNCSTDACAGCGVAELCGMHTQQECGAPAGCGSQPGRMLALTVKGRRAAAA